jgi:hypothetical protein
MATEYILRRADGQAFGTFEQAQAIIRIQFPTVRFAWTPSGLEKIRIAEQRGVKLPHQIHEILKNLPALMEGVAEGDGYHVTFGLGEKEPVSCLYVTPRGDAAVLVRGLTELETEAGAEFEVSLGE